MHRLLPSLAAGCWLVAAAATAQPAEQALPSTAAPVGPSPAEAAVAADALVSRVEAGIEFARLVNDDRPGDALSIGTRMVELTEREFGRNSPQTAEAYSQLGDAQRRAGVHDAAEQSFLAAVEIYRAVDGPFSPSVIAPLTGLGDNYHDSAQYLSAVSAYNEARTVNRRAFGLLNERQIPLLDRMTQSLLELDQPLEADQQQLEALRLVERNWPPDSNEALAAIYKYARWLRDGNRFQEERDQYARALRIIRESFGNGDARQVEPLVGIGNSFRNQRIPEGQGTGALHEALTILLAQSEPDELAIAEVLRDIGDWEVAFSKVNYDGAEYRRAWQLLDNVEDGAKLRTDWFTGPSYVLREPISQRGLSQEQNAPSGHVLVTFDLDASGRSANVVVVESDPPGLKDESVLRHVRRSRFRPQMADGVLVPGQQLALQFNYRYTPDELPTPEQQEDPAE